jgi:hypothetical protein
MKLLFTFFIALFVILLTSCSSTKIVALEDVLHPAALTLPEDGSTPIAEGTPSPDALRTVTFKDMGDKGSIKKGESVNFVYQRMDTKGTYLMCESTDEGYDITLMKLDKPLDITFSRLCQIYIVATPELTTITLEKDVRYEQIVWTPRPDGTWEVRLGTAERGCKAESLNRLEKQRTDEYNKRLMETKMK